MERLERNARGDMSWSRWKLGVVCLLSLIVAMAELSVGAELESVNLTSEGITWATTMDMDELEQPDEKVTLVEQPDAGEGFNSMESMLQWAIGHSDPEKLKVAAKDARKLSSEELERRRDDIKEMMDRLRVPSDAELMKIAIADLLNSTLSIEDRQRALQELLILVEPIDNARDLDKLGGLILVIAELDQAVEELRTTAAWILGKACQNNLVVQKQVLEYRGLPRLMEMVESSSPEESVKALYAVSAMIRNFPLGQQEFYMNGGAGLLERLLGGSAVDIRLRRKSLFLVADLAEQSHSLRDEQLDATMEESPPVPDSVNLFSERLLNSVVNLMEATDMDTQEKALMAIRSLSNVSNRIRKTLVNVCGVENTLKKLKSQLHELHQDVDQADFARDLEALRQEVADTISNSKEPSETEGLRDEL